jgi:hypothetical protein
VLEPVEKQMRLLQLENENLRAQLALVSKS